MSRKRVLIVDDDRSLRQLYRTALAFAGFSVDTAEDGLTALRKIDEEAPNLIVLDLHMPCVDGLAVLGELRANSHTGGIPVVVVTGADYQFRIADAAVVLKKPCEPADLVSVVEHYLQDAA